MTELKVILVMENKEYNSFKSKESIQFKYVHIKPLEI